MSERGLRGPEGDPGQDGRHGRDGANGVDGKDGMPGLQGDPGKDGRDGIDSKDGAAGKDGARGLDGKDGTPGARGPAGPRGPAGKDGHDGQDGEMGPMPDHRWRGTELSFQNPDGSFGRYVDLRGPQGAGGLGGGSGAGMTKTQALQLNTLLAIFGGWISTVPDVAIEEVAADGLSVTAEGSATGFYSSIPGGEPVDAQYEWDWGDGSMNVDELTADHTYAEAGTYTISFRAKNHIGWSEPVSEEIEVSEIGPTDPFWAQTVLVLQGDDLIDATGRHTVNVNEGTPTFSADGINFDGATSLRIDDDLDDFSFPGSGTIDLQIVGVTAAAVTAVLVATISNVLGGEAGEWEIFTRGPASFNGGFYAPTGAFLEPLSPPWVTDAPVDVAFTFNSGTGTVRLWVNGAQVAEQVGGPANYVPGTPPPFFIGREGGPTAKFFKGAMRLRITQADRGYFDGYTPPTWPVPTN